MCKALYDIFTLSDPAESFYWAQGTPYFFHSSWIKETSYQHFGRLIKCIGGVRKHRRGYYNRQGWSIFHVLDSLFFIVYVTSSDKSHSDDFFSLFNQSFSSPNIIFTSARTSRHVLHISSELWLLTCKSSICLSSSKKSNISITYSCRKTASGILNIYIVNKNVSMLSVFVLISQRIKLLIRES